MNIAICDDNITIGVQIENYLKSFEYETMNKINVEIFLSGEDLYKNLKEKNYYDLIFLDIEMDILNGIQVGTIIREQMLNEITQIVYISSNHNYAMQLFKIRPLDFIIKPFDFATIIGVINKAMKVVNINNNTFQYSKGQIEYKVSIKDILYFESHGRKITMHTINNSDTFYDTLSNISEKLPYFINIHKSYLINYNYIKRLEYNCVEMVDSVVLPISQIHRKDIRNIILKLEKNNNNLL